MPHIDHVKRILGDTLGINTRHLTRDSSLMGSIPELDSMAVLGVLTALEDQFEITVEDDEISARHFATLGALTAFVQYKLAQ